MIVVKSNLRGQTVALWERHPDHPGGEVFVAGPGDVPVAETPAVQAALKRGDLVEVKPPAKPKRRTRKAN